MEGASRASLSDGRSPCPHFPRCDGCPLIGRPYAQQLRHKEAILQAALNALPRRHSGEVLPIIGSRATFGYRNQAKLVLGKARTGVRAGLYAPGTHRLVDASACVVHHPAINKVVAAVRRLVDRSGLSIYDERSGEGTLRYLIVRYSFWLRQSLAVFVATERPACLTGLARDLRRSVRGLTGVVLNLNRTRGNVLFGDAWLSLSGRDGLVDRFGTLKLGTRAGSFVQANPWVAGRLYRTVEKWVRGRDHETIVDLYAGTGAIALTVAPGVKRVFAVEESETAVGDARSNARRNGISNVRVLSGAAETVLRGLRGDLGKADVVTLNPPRTGVLSEVVDAVAALDPRTIVYMSCNPKTLVRDLERFRQSGYVTERLQPADMLPQTEHVECLALLNRDRA